MARPDHVNVLIPTFGINSSDQLLRVGNAVTDCYGGEATVLSVVQVPQDRSLSEGALVVRRRRGLLRKLSQLHAKDNLRAEVRTAHSVQAGIRDAVRDARADLVLLPWTASRGKTAASLGDMLSDPPCDLAILKRGNIDQVRTVLVPARGGPHAKLALAIAEAIAEHQSAMLTLLHIRQAHWTAPREAKEEQFFQDIRAEVRYPNVREVEIEAETVEAGLLQEGAKHDLVIMGSSARDDPSLYALGRIPEIVANRLKSGVMIVKTREPVTAQTFEVSVSRFTADAGVDVSQLVDRWFAENTFHSHEFRGLKELVELKERQGKTISLALPTLNEEKTVGQIIATLKRRLVEEYPLIDEIVVVDSESEDKTVQIAHDLGARVFKHPQILPQHGSYVGKGEGLWKSLYVTSGDIVVWLDSDITRVHPKFVYGLVGPLLLHPRLAFVKGFYRRPLDLGGQKLTTGGGRVTELTARPLINLFYPHLSGLVQPLAGEMAGRREVLESVPFFTGYGVETGLLIDILDQFGLQSIAQADLQYRIHRNQTLLSLSKMAFAIVQVVVKRLGDRERMRLMEEMNTSMKLIHYSPAELYLEVKEIREHERPPIKSLMEYAAREDRRSAAPAAAEPDMAAATR